MSTDRWPGPPVDTFAPFDEEGIAADRLNTPANYFYDAGNQSSERSIFRALANLFRRLFP